MKSVVRRGGDAAAAAVLTRRYTLAAGDFLHYFHNVVLIQKNNENSTIGVAIAGQAGGGLSRGHRLSWVRHSHPFRTLGPRGAPRPPRTGRPPPADICQWAPPPLSDIRGPPATHPQVPKTNKINKWTDPTDAPCMTPPERTATAMHRTTTPQHR
jgi:hypothetical protein